MGFGGDVEPEETTCGPFYVDTGGRWRRRSLNALKEQVSGPHERR